MFKIWYYRGGNVIHINIYTYTYTHIHIHITVYVYTHKRGLEYGYCNNEQQNRTY